MKFEDYEPLIRKTRKWPDTTTKMGFGGDPIEVKTPWDYPLAGLVSEVGELGDLVKKWMRDEVELGFLQPDPDRTKKELGDILYYLTAICHAFNLTLEEVAATNIEKLESRLERGKIQGSGDDR